MGLTSHLPEEDGAEQEDGVETQQTQTQSTIQPPAVQMNTGHLKAERQLWGKATTLPHSFYLGFKKKYKSVVKMRSEVMEIKKLKLQTKLIFFKQDQTILIYIH